MSDDEKLTPSTELVEISAPVRDIEPIEAQSARTKLERLYTDDLPRLVSMWLMAQRSPNTRRAYARGFHAWSDFCSSVGVHPLAARRPHGDAYMRMMEERSMPNSTANARMSAVSSFYDYAIDVDATEINPVKKVKRQKIDQDHSDTEGLTEDEMTRLLVEAKKQSARSYALCLLLYTVGLRIDGALGADVTDLGYDAGHKTLTVTLKGGATAKKALPPVTAHALEVYLSGRTEGPLFVTRTGERMREPEAWKMLRRLATRASLPQAGSIHPHVLRHCHITHGLDKGVALHIMQDSVDHKDPRTTRRYDRARGRLVNSPAYTVGASIAERLDDADT
jgi:site-specific recombinase XerD